MGDMRGIGGKKEPSFMPGEHKGGHREKREK